MPLGWLTVRLRPGALLSLSASAHRFARYWRLIRPASGVIRRNRLTAIKRRAERANGEADPEVPAR
jgi:hypothetical protein